MRCPAGFDRSTVIDFFPRFAHAKYADSVVSLPLASFSQGGPKARESSPFVGRSTLMTSAPRSARFWPVHGAASTRDRSRTRIWDSGPGMTGPLGRDSKRRSHGGPWLPGVRTLLQVDLDPGVL